MHPAARRVVLFYANQLAVHVVYGMRAMLELLKVSVHN